MCHCTIGPFDYRQLSMTYGYIQHTSAAVLRELSSYSREPNINHESDQDMSFQRLAKIFARGGKSAKGKSYLEYQETADEIKKAKTREAAEEWERGENGGTFKITGHEGDTTSSSAFPEDCTKPASDDSVVWSTDGHSRRATESKEEKPSSTIGTLSQKATSVSKSDGRRNDRQAGA